MTPLAHGLRARVRSLWRGLRRRPDVEAEMAEEFRLHQELRAADLERSGLSRAEAARQARLEFGSPERAADAGRQARGLQRIDALQLSWLDFKLGFRMLVKYPGLTLVGGLAIAFAIWVGAGTFELATQVLRPTLPLPDGDRIVGVQNWDASTSRLERRIGHDLADWRTSLASVRDLGAFRGVERNLITSAGAGAPITVAEISASAFQVTRVAPLLGRALVAADEQLGAPPVVVLGHAVWQARFDGDSSVVGQTVRLGADPHVVVGVMPAGYAFPINHGAWAPLRLNVLEFGRREGPALQLFGRLAPGVSLEAAQAELATLGQRAAADFPDTHQYLQPRVLPYARSIFNLPGMLALGVMSINVPVVMLLVLVCANVALLLFARAATRESEIVVRSALGASRGRIVMQLFAEALVLGGIAAVVGLAASGFGLRWLMRLIELEMLEGRPLPFWFHASMSPTTLLYVGLLTVLVAVLAGVLPALKITRGVGARLRAVGAGGGGVRFGGIWTAVIVSQVAVTVAFPAIAFFARQEAQVVQSLEFGVREEEYLSARLEMDRQPRPGVPDDSSDAAFQRRFRASYAALQQRLTNHPAVAGVTFADRLPRMYHPYRLIEMDEGGTAPRNPTWPNGHRVSSVHVDPGFFDVLDTPILAGRGFHSGDVVNGTNGIIVNQSFVQLVLGGRNPIGRRLRYVHFEEWDEPRPDGGDPGPWYEIVGVVRDLAMHTGGMEQDPKIAGFYHAAAPGSLHPAQIAIHVRGDASTFIPALRGLVTATDPTLRLYEPMRLDTISESELEFIDFWFRLLVGVSAIALTLSLAGIYAVMSFTVARRTREIGIRVALGAKPRRVLATIFRRPLVQVSLGVVAGTGLVVLLMLTMAGGKMSAAQALSVATYSVLMFGVCLLACIVPTRRALRVQPTEALRADG